MRGRKRLLDGTIVGVVADFKHARLDAPPFPEVYVPHRRALQTRNVRLAIRTAGPPSAIAADLRTRIGDIDRMQPVSALRRL